MLWFSSASVDFLIVDSFIVHIWIMSFRMFCGKTISACSVLYSPTRISVFWSPRNRQRGVVSVDKRKVKRGGREERIYSGWQVSTNARVHRRDSRKAKIAKISVNAYTLQCSQYVCVLLRSATCGVSFTSGSEIITSDVTVLHVRQQPITSRDCFLKWRGACAHVSGTRQCHE